MSKRLNPSQARRGKRPAHGGKSPGREAELSIEATLAGSGDSPGLGALKFLLALDCPPDAGTDERHLPHEAKIVFPEQAAMSSSLWGASRQRQPAKSSLPVKSAGSMPNSAKPFLMAG